MTLPPFSITLSLMLDTMTYAAGQPGPRLLVLGAVHGNEKCGTNAIRRICEEFESGPLKLAAGRVTFIPVCNPRAFAADTRFVERNLNRYLVPQQTPDSYEAELGNHLCPFLADCDILLDIHSYTAGGAPFVVVDNAADEKEHAFIASLGAEVALYGWKQAYAATGRNRGDTGREESTGTTEYARRHGARAVTLECGQHKDPEADQVAYHAVHNALRHLGLVVEQRQARAVKTPRAVTMTNVFYHDDPGSFPQPWQNFGTVRAGELMATRASGEALIAPHDGVIIMPKATFAAGEEWFYFGIEQTA